MAKAASQRKHKDSHLGFEATLWATADKLRGNLDAAEYKHVVFGLIFLKSATFDEIRAHGSVLTPGRYVGAEEAEDDGEPFEQEIKRLTAKLEEQFAESAKLEKANRANLEGLGF